MQAYLWTLPEPVVSYKELKGIDNTSIESLRVVWNSWSQDPIKATILRAVLPHLRFYYLMGDALFQKKVLSSSSTMEERNSLLKCFQTLYGDGPLGTLKELARHYEILSSPISDVQQEEPPPSFT